MARNLLASGRRVWLESVLLLLGADIGDDRLDLVPVESGDRFHVPEVPMVSDRSVGDRRAERFVGMMIRCVDLREVRRSLVGATQIGPVA